MARIRSVKPEFWTDRSLARRLSMQARLFYIALWNFADEHARVNGDPLYLRGQIFPYDDVSIDFIEDLIRQLSDAGKAVCYEEQGDPYLFLTRLDQHQRLEPEKVPSRLPAPPKPQVDELAQIGADESARDSDESAPGMDELPLLYVAGSREQVAGSRDPSTPAASEPAQTGFDEFWTYWPRKVSKADAEKAWNKAIKSRADPAAIVKAAASYAERCQLIKQDPKFIPHPATWLNRGSWGDDLDAVLPLPPQRAPTNHETFRDSAPSTFRPPK